MRTESHFRSATAAEAAIIRRLLTADFPGKCELAKQLDNYRVRIIDDEGSLEIRVIDATATVKVEKRIPVEAQAPDTDGIHIHFLLYVVDGFAKELEIYKDDQTQIVRLPRADELEVMVLGK